MYVVVNCSVRETVGAYQPVTHAKLSTAEDRSNSLVHGLRLIRKDIGYFPGSWDGGRRDGGR